MIPVEFLIFGVTLLGVAVFHRHTLDIALLGLPAITAYKMFFGDFYGAARACSGCCFTCRTSG